MNQQLELLHPYPFEKLAKLFAGVESNTEFSNIRLSIGEPQHAMSAFIRAAVDSSLAGLAVYPATKGERSLREAIASWLQSRYGLTVDAETEILPVNGSREGLFAIAQAVVDRQQRPYVVSPNPFYQIYEGATILAGGQLIFAPSDAGCNFATDYSRITPEQWQQTSLIYVCSPANPSGYVMNLDEWRWLFEMADRYGFIIASDECYSEIYLDQPVLGGLQAAALLGRQNFARLVVFSSLSKRSSLPGLRSGFVAGDANVIKDFLRYRTYHGCAMSPMVQRLSELAWKDEQHVTDNRQQYAEKFRATAAILRESYAVNIPAGGFYYWLSTHQFAPQSDTEFARQLQAKFNVTVLPGSYLARLDNGINPGDGYVRIALVAPLEECCEAARRLVAYAKTLA